MKIKDLTVQYLTDAGFTTTYRGYKRMYELVEACQSGIIIKLELILDTEHLYSKKAHSGDPNHYYTTQHVNYHVQYLLATYTTGDKHNVAQRDVIVSTGVVYTGD